MPTNEERNKIAARLRCVAEHGVPEWVTPINCIVICIEQSDGTLYSSNEKLFSSLADLIEIEPERTCKNLATRKDDFYCSECGCEVVGCMVDDFGSFDNPLCFSYCPNCRAKVVI